MLAVKKIETLIMKQVVAALIPQQQQPVKWWEYMQ